MHGVFDHVVVEQCTSGETAPLTVLEFVPVGGLNVSNHWNQVCATSRLRIRTNACSVEASARCGRVGGFNVRVWHRAPSSTFFLACCIAFNCDSVSFCLVRVGRTLLRVSTL